MLKGSRFPAGESPGLDHGGAIRAAYTLDSVPTDSDTLAHPYDDSCGMPYDWWCESRKLVVKWMREAYEDRLPHLVEALEP